jgi:hypothetical protein
MEFHVPRPCNTVKHLRDEMKFSEANAIREGKGAQSEAIEIEIS